MTTRLSPSNPAQAQEQRLLEAALALGTEDERRAFLAAIADPGARRRLEELVAASAEADSFFGAPPIQNAGVELVEPATLLAPAAEVPAQTLGRYKLLEKIGEGGFGEVWMAEQREPVKRRVALKILKLGMDSRQVVARFEAERQALAMMDHPNIAKILDADVADSGRPYFVMELVRGTRITEYCDQNQLTTQQRLDLFIKVCQAIQHAHQKGIIHRDIKPSNILVTVNDGAAVPKVIDFGIAKAMQGELTDKTVFTQFQQFIGTPAYISPEQAEMSSLDIDTRADIYSLGVLLYELLVGQTPFDAKEMMKGGIDALRKIIREKEPLRPSTKLNTLPGDARTTAGKRRQTDASKLVHQLQGDLDWIVMKCLEKDRTRRYDTANGLAMDIQRHLANEPVVARPPSTAYTMHKAWQRNKLPFTASAAVVLALLAGAGVSTWQAFRATQAKQAVITEQKQTEKARAEEAQQRFRAEQESEEKGRALAAAHRSRYAADMVLAQQALAVGNLGRARELLRNHQPKTGVEDIRGWEWRYLWGRSSSDELFTLGQHSNGVLCVASSWSGDLLASGGYDRVVKLWDIPTRKLIAEIVQRDAIQCLAFSPKGNLLAIAAHGKHLGLWDIVSREEVWRIPILKDLPGHPFAASIAFAPQTDGVLAVGDQSGVVTLWDTTTRAVLASHSVSRAAVHVLAYSGDGRRLAVASRDGMIRICDANSLQPLVSLANSGGESLAFSRDNRILASGGYDGTIFLSNTESGAAVGRLTNHGAWVGGLAFLPDGRRLVSTSADHSIRFWDMTTQQEVARLKGHEHEVHQVVVSPDGERLATGSKDQSIKLWNALPKPSPQTAFVVNAERFNHAVSADRQVFLSHLADGTMQLRNSKDLSLLRTFPAPITPSADDWYSAWALSPGGRMLALGQDDGHVRVWNTTDQKCLTDFAAHAGPIAACRYSEDGRILATVGDDRKVRVWEVHTGKILHEYDAPPFAHRLYFSRDGRKLACAHWNEEHTHGSVRVWDLKEGGEIMTFPAHLQQIWDIAFSPDGQMLATGSPDSTAKLWDLNDVTQPKFVLRGRLLAVISLAFSPDGRRLAVSGDGGETKIWDVRSGQELVSLKGGDGFIRYTVFVDEETLLTASGKSGPHTELFLWHAPSVADIARTEAKEKTEGKQP